MISKFRDEHEFLSNFHVCPFMVGTVEVISGEHAFQALKATNTMDAIKVLGAPTPRMAKRIGHEISLRGDWEMVKESMMDLVLLHKFFKGSIMAQKLLDTGDEELVEGNDWGDRTWGQCPVGVGQNLLGKALMRRRAKLQEP